MTVREISITTNISRKVLGVDGLAEMFAVCSLNLDYPCKEIRSENRFPSVQIRRHRKNIDFSGRLPLLFMQVICESEG
jgi:hypothetical protein